MNSVNAALRHAIQLSDEVKRLEARIVNLEQVVAVKIPDNPEWTKIVREKMIALNLLRRERTRLVDRMIQVAMDV